MILELIGTWLLVGFVSAIGWNVADETVNKPYLDPAIQQTLKTNTPAKSSDTDSKE